MLALKGWSRLFAFLNVKRKEMSFFWGCIFYSFCVIGVTATLAARAFGAGHFFAEEQL